MNDTMVLTATRAWASGSFLTISANLFVKFTIFYTDSSEVNVLGNANRFIASAWLIWTVGWKWNLLALTVSVQLQPGIPMVVFGSGASKTRRVVPRKTLTQVRITFRLIGVVTAVLEINRNYHITSMNIVQILKMVTLVSWTTLELWMCPVKQRLKLFHFQIDSLLPKRSLKALWHTLAKEVN